jgi:hypothetical protein
LLFVLAAIIGVAWWGVTKRASTIAREQARSTEDADDPEKDVRMGAYPALRVVEPPALMALERRGFTLGAMLGAHGETTHDLGETPRWRALVGILEKDLAELDARTGVGPAEPNRPFKISWLRSELAHFELVGFINRIDRWFVEPGCGEVRLTYRLALANPGRPQTRLPMTLNLVFREPADAPPATPGWEPSPTAPPSCRSLAERWLSLPATGRARADALALILREASPLARIEVNLQNLHGPSFQQDQADHAEYLLRVFDVKGDTVSARPLLDTPRPDLNAAQRTKLRAWIALHFDAIDTGAFVLPEEFLAERIVSVTAHGLARLRNRPFKRLYDEDEAFDKAIARLDFSRAKLVKSPVALVRRLDQATCTGCHESRAVAGFHLLGEERDDKAVFNAFFHGTSPHADEEMPWRDQLLRAIASGAPFAAPRPFADHAMPVEYGGHCGLGDPGFSSWTCDPGFKCRDLYGDDVGTCIPAAGRFPGDSCQSSAMLFSGDGAGGDRLNATEPPRDCTSIVDPKNTELAGCTPDAYGFSGGLCSEECSTLGATMSDYICADIPVSGYEADCFDTPKPIEPCVQTHLARRWIRACSATMPCRDDYACARVAGTKTGACVPPYFVFQTRVDGPTLDR